MLSSWKPCCSGISQRWVFAVLSSVGLCIGSILRVIISITIIEMAVPIEQSSEQHGGSCKTFDSSAGNPVNRTFSSFRSEDNALGRRYPWDASTQGAILSSFFWSYAFAQCFTGGLSERFGGKSLLGAAIFVPAVLSFVTPWAVDWGGSRALIATRVLMGLANGGMYPVASTMTSRWTTAGDRTTIGSVIYAGPLIGAFVGTITPARIIKYSAGVGWPAVFYLYGAIGMLWYPFWCLLVYEDPHSHPFVSDKEIKHFLQSAAPPTALSACSEATDERRPPAPSKSSPALPSAPWRRILGCKEYWAFTMGLIGTNWAYFAMVSDLPTYMGNVVDFSPENNGTFSALPYLLMWLDTLASTWISDKILQRQWLSLTSVRKLLGTLSIGVPALFLVLASYAECDKSLVVVCFAVGLTLMGSFYPSVMMGALDLSPNYAGSLMAVANGLAAIVGIIVPYAIGLLTPNQTIAEWRLVFWIVFFMSVLSNVFYVVWFKAEIQPWNDPNSARENVQKNDADVEKDVV